MTPEMEEALKDPTVETEFWRMVKKYREQDGIQHPVVKAMLTFRSEGANPLSLLALRLARTYAMSHQLKTMDIPILAKLEVEDVIARFEKVGNLDVERLWLDAFEFPSFTRQRFIRRIRQLQEENR